MNKPEYNQTMKRHNRDLERMTSEIKVLRERMVVSRAKRDKVILEGWTE